MDTTRGLAARGIMVSSLTFDIGSYQRDLGVSTPFFPEACVTFNIRDTDEDDHLPLLVSPYGYSAFRGI
jgi:5-hydroxyisourate hydrolase